MSGGFRQVMHKLTLRLMQLNGTVQADKVKEQNRNSYFIIY